MVLKRVPLLFLVILLKVANLTTYFAYPIALPNCTDTCGNTNIPYPFGIEPGCYREGFDVICNRTTNQTYLSKNHIEITNISILTAEVDAYVDITSICYSSENVTSINYTTEASITGTQYLFSSERNMFTVLGCYTVAFIIGADNHNSSFASGCLSYCNSTESTSNGSCDGVGCCHTSIPKGLNYYEVEWGYDRNYVWKFNPCNYAFLVDKKWYNFSQNDLIGENFLNREKKAPVVLDWAIRDGSCQVPTIPPEACKSNHSMCYNTTNGVGYLCNCSQGFEGNPYLKDGCKDKNECDFPDKYPCQGHCINIPGDYECKCSKGKKGNGKLGTCIDKFSSAAKWAVGICVGLVVVLAFSFAIVTTSLSRKYKKAKEEYFRKNGGQQLQEIISQQVETIRVFTEKELEKATNNFDKDQIIGSGGHGMVYRGTLDNGRVVAIKRCKEIDEGQKEEFVNEIVILSQINHRHVVRLLGCCLEVDIPMLVYEFISNGTLSSYLHDKKNATKIPLDTRMRIIRESAEALAFMHSTMNRPIIHGDVKTLNILLDDEFNAKVSDFGASSLVPLDENQFVKFVQGTVGYLDPECFYTHQLTEKSDVFAFGVVILELLTRKPAIFTDESGEKKSLLNSFRVIMSENRFNDILDHEIVNETSMEVLREVAQLALRCINFSGEERPFMVEVVESLQMLTRSKSKLHQHVHKNQEEINQTKHQEETSTSLISEISPHGPSDSFAIQNTETTSALLIDLGR